MSHDRDTPTLPRHLSYLPHQYEIENNASWKDADQRSRSCHTPVTQTLTKRAFSWYLTTTLKHGVTGRKPSRCLKKKWCPGADLNHRHADFQSTALPTELLGFIRFVLTSYRFVLLLSFWREIWQVFVNEIISGRLAFR